MRSAGVLALLLAAAISGSQPAKPRIARMALAPLESSFDSALSKPGQQYPFDLLGNTRGVYLGGFGVVFTAEVNLIIAPRITPFRQFISKEDVARVHQQKTANLPVLKQAMRELMERTASTLDALPPGEQVVVAVTLFYYSWEQKDGLPSQILMQASKSALGKGGAAAVRVEEL
ncbi:MAG: hypothetical protein IT159_15650 [Bryobacterales bacterium]|nr:hypothetical protein [Bryobacterales bacterium]